jgi:hypothetical protein
MVCTLGKDSCWIVTLGCDRLRPRSPWPAFGAMVQKTRFTAFPTPSLPTPAELGCGLKGKRDYVTVALLVDCALRRQELAELEMTTAAYLC